MIAVALPSPEEGESVATYHALDRSGFRYCCRLSLGGGSVFLEEILRTGIAKTQRVLGVNAETVRPSRS